MDEAGFYLAREGSVFKFGVGYRRLSLTSSFQQRWLFVLLSYLFFLLPFRTSCLAALDSALGLESLRRCVPSALGFVREAGGVAGLPASCVCRSWEEVCSGGWDGESRR